MKHYHRTGGGPDKNALVNRQRAGEKSDASQQVMASHVSCLVAHCSSCSHLDLLIRLSAPFDCNGFAVRQTKQEIVLSTRLRLWQNSAVTNFYGKLEEHDSWYDCRAVCVSPRAG